LNFDTPETSVNAPSSVLSTDDTFSSQFNAVDLNELQQNYCTNLTKFNEVMWGNGKSASFSMGTLCVFTACRNSTLNVTKTYLD